MYTGEDVRKEDDLDKFPRDLAFIERSINLEKLSYSIINNYISLLFIV